MNAKGGAATLWGVQKVKRRKKEGGARGPVFKRVMGRFDP